MKNTNPNLLLNFRENIKNVDHIRKKRRRAAETIYLREIHQELQMIDAKVDSFML